MRLKLRAIVAIALCGVAMLALAVDSVKPANVAFNSLRDEAQGYISGVYYYEGSSLLLSNCVIYSGTTTNTAKQGLSGVTIAVDVGTTTTNWTYAGTVISAAQGKWKSTIVVPTGLSQTYIQLKITDSHTNSYIYPWKMMRTKASL